MHGPLTGWVVRAPRQPVRVVPPKPEAGVVKCTPAPVSASTDCAPPSRRFTHFHSTAVLAGILRGSGHVDHRRALSAPQWRRTARIVC